MARQENPYQHLAIRVLEHAVQDWTRPMKAPGTGQQKTREEAENAREEVRRWLTEEADLVKFWCDAAGLPVTSFYRHMREHGYYGPVPDPDGATNPTDPRRLVAA